MKSDCFFIEINDRLYVHKDYQGKGVATAICDRLEKEVCKKVITHASITARSFFEKRGYKVIKEQHIERNGIMLANFVMELDVKYDIIDIKCRFE